MLRTRKAPPRKESPTDAKPGDNPAVKEHVQNVAGGAILPGLDAFVGNKTSHTKSDYFWLLVVIATAVSFVLFWPVWYSRHYPYTPPTHVRQVGKFD